MEIPKKRQAKLGFHGTNYDYEGEVLPRGKTRNMHYAISGEDDTYFLPADSPDPAQNTANEVGAWNWSGGGYWESEGVESRRRVHVTQPVGTQHLDNNINGMLPRSNSELKTMAAVAPSQKIQDTHWGPPATEGTSVTQTLPHVNWNQFGAPNWTTTIHAQPGYPTEKLDDIRPSDVSWKVREREWQASPRARNALASSVSPTAYGPEVPTHKPKRPKKGQGTLDLG